MGKNLKGKELGAGISQRKDGRYSARFVTSSGKRIEKYFPMLQDARKWLAEAKLNDENGSVGVSVGMTVDAWFEFWIVNIKDKTVRYNTARNYRERYRQNVKKHIGKMLMTDVKPMHCQKILNAMEADYAGSTIYQTLITLYNLFDSAVENAIILKNPVTKSVKLPKPVEKNTKVLTVDEQEKFMEEARYSSNYPQYFFILQTGVRTGEMVGLKWEDIGFEKNLISIRRSMEYRYTTGEWRVGPPKTKHGFREIPLTKANRDMLLEMKKQADGGRYVQEEFKEFVFINRKGMPTKNSTYDVHIAKLTKKAAIQNFSMHTLRHTFATRCIEAGMRPKTLQQILGHSSINITMNLYVHVTDEEKTKEMHKFEEYSIKMA